MPLKKNSGFPDPGFHLYLYLQSPLCMVQFTTVIQQFAEQGEKTGWSYITVPHDIAEQLKPGKFFRLVQRPGLKRSHPDNREVSLGGQARVYS
jgi:hypothetical protein